MVAIISLAIFVTTTLARFIFRFASSSYLVANITSFLEGADGGLFSAGGAVRLRPWRGVGRASGARSSLPRCHPARFGPPTPHHPTPACEDHFRKTRRGRFEPEIVLLCFYCTCSVYNFISLTTLNLV